jgi:hypothetical protein
MLWKFRSQNFLATETIKYDYKIRVKHKSVHTEYGILKFFRTQNAKQNKTKKPRPLITILR